MKELYNRTEVELLAAQKFTFIAHPVLHVTAVRKSVESESITATFEIEIGEYVIGELTIQYDTIERLLDAFDIADHAEIFELEGMDKA
jgi:hypothetical protein